MNKSFCLIKKIFKSKKPTNYEVKLIKNNVKFVFETKNLCVSYNKGKKIALKNINMKIRNNKITAFIGPSGCGKSTLIRCFNRMNDLIPDVIISGEIILDENKNILSKSRNVISLRTRIGMVFQKPNPFPMSIYNNVAFGPQSHGIKSKKELDKIVKNSLIDAALWDEVKNNLNDSAIGLSGGQQQRLCIARSLAMEPEVILMDEPTSALDPIATSKIELLINKLKEKYTIIIVTHSMQQATRISDYTAFFYMGELIELGRTRQVFTNPQNELTSNYVNGRVG